MRLFILAIGGTGSRVLHSLVMQLAAGVVPNDPATHKPMDNLTIVPIIIDPHKGNDAVQKTNKLLIRYREIRRSLYGDRPTFKGFFGVNIASLKEVTSDQNEKTAHRASDSFIFNMPDKISDSRFRKFIGIDSYGFDKSALLLSKMIFSEEELNTEMSEGFYGSPNIGTIALNVFQESEDYKALGKCFKENDRIFFVGSIFGGTGASGLPMLASAIRQDPAYIAMSNAYMGALIVMPYFAIDEDEKSEIQQKDFHIKTKTALKYYKDNLYDYLNDTYYVADKILTQPFDNDSGKDNQKTNKAHFVEFIGGLAIINFLSQLSKEGNNNATVRNGRKEACEQHFWEYELKEDGVKFGFPEIGNAINSLIFEPMASFHFLDRFISDGFFESNLGKPFAKNRGIEATAVTEDIKLFLESYRKWLSEMRNHGNGAHNFTPFSSNLDDDLSGEITGLDMKNSVLKRKLKISVFIEMLNQSKAHEDAQTQSGKLFRLIDDAARKALKEYYVTQNVL